MIRSQTWTLFHSFMKTSIIFYLTIFFAFVIIKKLHFKTWFDKSPYLLNNYIWAEKYVYSTFISRNSNSNQRLQSLYQWWYKYTSNYITIQMNCNISICHSLYMGQYMYWVLYCYCSTIYYYLNTKFKFLYGLH